MPDHSSKLEVLASHLDLTKKIRFALVDSILSATSKAELQLTIHDARLEEGSPVHMFAENLQITALKLMLYYPPQN